jgi:hypothetical protein
MGKKIYTQICLDNFMGRNNLVHVGVVGRMIVKWILTEALCLLPPASYHFPVVQIAIVCLFCSDFHLPFSDVCSSVDTCVCRLCRFYFIYLAHSCVS